MNRRKGIDTLQWMLIMVLLGLMFLTFAFNPLQQSLEEAARNHDKIALQEFVTAVNLAQTAPAKTIYTISFASRGRGSCMLRVHDGIVKMTFSEQSRQQTTYGYLLRTNTPIVAGTDGSVACTSGRAISITKESGRVTIQ